MMLRYINIFKNNTCVVLVLLVAIMFSATGSAQAEQSSGGEDLIMTPEMLKQKTKDITPTPSQPESQNAQEQKTPSADEQNSTPAETATEGAKPDTPQKGEAAATNNPATAESPEQQQGKDADANGESAKTEAPASLSTEPSTPMKDIVIKKDKDILAPANWIGSMMFNNNDLKVVMAARQIYLKNYKGSDGGENGDPGLKLSEQEIAAAHAAPKAVHTPLVTLDSIAFFDSTHWSIWANGKKYSVGETLQNLEIKSVTVDKVTFLWQAPSPDLFFPEWKNISTVQGDKLVIKRGNNIIEINEETMQITFSLYPNQTFIGRNLDIVEGRATNASGYDIIPVAISEPSNAIDKILESTVPKIMAPFKPN